MPETAIAAIALGSNLPSEHGTRENNLETAIERIKALGEIVSVSRFFDTAPVDFLDQPRFLNAALLLRTELPPLNLLNGLLKMEEEMGRVRLGMPAKGPRIIDLDLIWVEDQVIQSQVLTLPHPAMEQRKFVLEPLCEIAPAWVHPVLGVGVCALLGRLRAGLVEL